MRIKPVRELLNVITRTEGDQIANALLATREELAKTQAQLAELQALADEAQSTRPDNAELDALINRTYL